MSLGLFEGKPWQAYAYLTQPWITSEDPRRTLLLFPDGRVLPASEFAKTARKG